MAASALRVKRPMTASGLLEKRPMTASGLWVKKPMTASGLWVKKPMVGAGSGAEGGGGGQAMVEERAQTKAEDCGSVEANGAEMSQHRSVQNVAACLVYSRVGDALRGASFSREALGDLRRDLSVASVFLASTPTARHNIPTKKEPSFVLVQATSILHRTGIQKQGAFGALFRGPA